MDDCENGSPRPVYEGGRVESGRFLRARWDLLPVNRYMWASVQTVRGCPKYCSFCSVWRVDGQRPRQNAVDTVTITDCIHYLILKGSSALPDKLDGLLAYRIGPAFDQGAVNQVAMPSTSSL